MRWKNKILLDGNPQRADTWGMSKRSIAEGVKGVSFCRVEDNGCFLSSHFKKLLKSHPLRSKIVNNCLNLAYMASLEFYLGRHC